MQWTTADHFLPSPREVIHHLHRSEWFVPWVSTNQCTRWHLEPSFCFEAFAPIVARVPQIIIFAPLPTFLFFANRCIIQLFSSEHRQVPWFSLFFDWLYIKAFLFCSRMSLSVSRYFLCVMLWYSINTWLDSAPGERWNKYFSKSPKNS